MTLSTPAQIPVSVRTFSAESEAWTPSPITTPLRRNSPLTILTHNIDFASPCVSKRHSAYLSSLSPPSGPTILLLQEVHSSHLPTSILTHPLIRVHYQAITDIHPRAWCQTATFVSRHIGVSRAWRIPYEDSSMGRDLLLIDIPLEGGGLLAVGNTHLESLPIGEEQREVQMGTVADYLTAPEVIAGIVGGDMNSIGAADAGLPARNGLEDVWEVQQRKNGGDVGDEEGFTWGYQPKCQFSPGRLDKLLCAGELGLIEDKDGRIIRRVGVGSKFVPDEEDPWEEGKEPWISDHYGLEVTIEIPVESDDP